MFTHRFSGDPVRAFRAVGLLLILSMAVSACASQPTGVGASATPAATANLGGNLNVRLQSDWNTFDPSGSMIPTGVSSYVIVGVYDRLLGNGPKGELVPYLAKAWTFPDSASVKFDLRTDATCTDGTPITPTVVANSLSRLFKGPNAAPFFGPGMPAITTDDAAHTVTFKWPKPNADAVYGFALSYASVICPAGLSNLDKLDTTPFGSGPYTLKEAKHGESAKLVKNPAWKWGPSGLTAADLPDSVTFLVVTSDTTAANQLVTRELDVAQIVGPDADRLNSNQSLRHLTTSSFKVNPLTMNATPPHVTADPQVRRAIMTAINPDEWNQAAFNGKGITSTSIFTKNATCYEAGTAALLPKPSVDEAKRILTAAGYAAGSDGKFSKGGKPLAVTVAGSPTVFGKGTEYVATQLSAVGMSVTLVDVDRNTFVTNMRGGNFDIAYFPIGSGDVPSSQIQFIAGPLPPKGTNFSYYVDPTLDADVDAALNAGQADRCQAWSKFQLDLLRNYDMLPLATATQDVYTQQKIAVALVTGLLDIATLRRTP